MLPKFLIADNSENSEDIVYVVHTERPRCIFECDFDGFFSNLKIHWIDDEPASQGEIDALMDEASEFYESELDDDDENYDDDNE